MYYAPLIEVSQPVFDAERQIVTGYARSSATGGDHSFYCWVDGELVLVREVTLYFDQKIVVKDLVDGQMTEVYRKEWEGEPESYDALYKWSVLDYWLMRSFS